MSALAADSPAHAPLTPVAFLRRSASVWGDRIAVGFEGAQVTYEALLERVERLAGGLRAFGLRPGDRVATLLPNLPAMLELHFAVAGSRCVLVPMNIRLSAKEYAYVLDHSGARCLVTCADFVETVDAATATLRDPPSLIVADGPDYASLAERSSRLELATGSEDDLLAITYTSGTTGHPKGVMYTHRGATLQALGVVNEARLDCTSAYLWTLPMFHCNGWAFVWAVTASGGRHECLRSFDPSVLWRLIREEHITHLCGAPTVVAMLVEAEDAGPLDHPVDVFVGGAPPTPSLLERAAALGITVTHLYGLTETYGPLAVCARRPEWEELPQEEQARLHARQGVGTLVTEPLRVVDAQLRDVPCDGQTMGEVVMRGNNVTIGYYRDPEATASAFAGGWFHSGDLAVMHTDGYIEIRDRLKDIVISGGENVSTIEVEGVLAEHPDVLEAAVVGRPDDRWGEVLVAFVVRRPGGRVSVEGLQQFASRELARFKVPRSVDFVDELPKTATGKVQKFALRELARAPQGRV